MFFWFFLVKFLVFVYSWNLFQNKFLDRNPLFRYLPHLVCNNYIWVPNLMNRDMSSIIWLQDLSFLLTPNARVLCYRLCEKKTVASRKQFTKTRWNHDSPAQWIRERLALPGFYFGYIYTLCKGSRSPHRSKIKILIWLISLWNYKISGQFRLTPSTHLTC